ncbi:alpha/beta fold hydrolase [Mucilaginibacter celer]|uniref:Alpha/beta fold hydrolase n=1 Tax=Mucilaginibacter celer TaxID=2305508 RepID=A0A494VMX1_9SPHI|nr:alpha/beta fold hydrolase [Mucilaginibacter celer]AYL94320.1 alpha/beta fold hydrolase [Mucilaginibacter celer]
MKNLLAAVFCAAIVAFTFTGCSKDDNVPPVNSKTFVIVHGAWSAPYAWQSVKAKLEAEGQKVVIVQLAGHGSDNTTAFNTIHLNTYRDQVVHVIDSLNTKVILCGHSMGGMVITQVAEKIPSKIEKMVYVNAFLPVNNQTLLDLANTDGGSLLGQKLIQIQDGVILDVPHDLITDIFVQDGSDAVKNLVISNYRTEPGMPFGEPATITKANYGSVDKYYIHTLQDHAITYNLQQRMVAAAGIKKTYTLNTSHSPFLAKPDSLSIILEKIAK